MDWTVGGEGGGGGYGTRFGLRCSPKRTCSQRIRIALVQRKCEKVRAMRWPRFEFEAAAAATAVAVTLPLVSSRGASEDGDASITRHRVGAWGCSCRIKTGEIRPDRLVDSLALVFRQGHSLKLSCERLASRLRERFELEDPRFAQHVAEASALRHLVRLSRNLHWGRKVGETTQGAA